MDPKSFFFKIKHIHNINEFMWFFDHQPIEAKILIGAAIFGCILLIYIFIVALFVDKHL